MFVICRKELKQFFSSLAGFLAVGLFLFVMGLILFVLPNTSSIDFNIFEYGFASLDKYFSLAPWILMLLIPAICMRLIADEYKQGTFELLITKPVDSRKIIIGKWLGAFLVALLALAPTLIYMFAIKALAFNNQIDTGAAIGSYIGLALLAGAFTAISLFASSITSNYIVSFLLAALINFIMYTLFLLVSRLPMFSSGADMYLSALGIDDHYKSISKGMLFYKDVIYFFIIIVLFLHLAHQQIIKRTTNYNKPKTRVILLAQIAACVGIILLSQQFRQGIDLTADKRFTLSTPTKDFLNQNEKEIEVHVLLQGAMPAELKKLKQSVDFFLQNCKAFAKGNMRVNYIDINQADNDSSINKFIVFAAKNGLKPISIQLEKGDEGTQNIKVLPGAIVTSGKRSVVVDFFKNAIAKDGIQDANNIYAGINKAEALLEYKFSQAFFKTALESTDIIALSIGNGESIDADVANLNVITQNYFAQMGYVDLNKVNGVPKEVSTVIINNPSKTFTDKAKINIDQFLLRGGNVLIAYNSLFATMDSLFNRKEGFLAFPLNTGLDDLLFNYGVRINPDILQAKYCDSIPLQVGEVDGKPQFQLFGWSYFPIATGNIKHPISKPIQNVYSEFISSIDTIPSSKTNKTILLTTQGATRKVKSPSIVKFEEGNLNVVLNKLTEKDVPVAVLVEGLFKSFYALRLTPALNDSIKAWTGAGLITESTKPGKLIVVSDGEMFSNAIASDPNGNPTNPTEMGYNLYTGKQYDNPDFYDNCLLYLSNRQDGLALKETKNKAYKTSYLDPLALKKPIAIGSAFNFETKTLWKYLCVIMPTLLVGICIWLFNVQRKRNYKRPITT
jgi:ABC-2 type transport system permease protein